MEIQMLLAVGSVPLLLRFAYKVKGNVVQTKLFTPIPIHPLPPPPPPVRSVLCRSQESSTSDSWSLHIIAAAAHTPFHVPNAARAALLSVSLRDISAVFFTPRWISKRSAIRSEAGVTPGASCSSLKSVYAATLLVTPLIGPNLNFGRKKGVCMRE